MEASKAWEVVYKRSSWIPFPFFFKIKLPINLSVHWTVTFVCLCIVLRQYSISRFSWWWYLFQTMSIIWWYMRMLYCYQKSYHCQICFYRTVLITYLGKATGICRVPQVWHSNYTVGYFSFDTCGLGRSTQPFFLASTLVTLFPSVCKYF